MNYPPQTSNSEGSPTVKKQRCLKIGGKEIACVQDKAQFKLTPGILLAGSVILLLLVRR